MIWTRIRLHVLYEKMIKIVPFGCKSLHRKKKKQRIFVEGLNFYLEHNTVRAVWSHNKVYLIYWALFVMYDYSLEGQGDKRALQLNCLHGDLYWFMMLWGLCQCACVQCITVYRGADRITVWSVLYVMSLMCSVPHCSANHEDVHTIDSVLSTAFWFVCFVSVQYLTVFYYYYF